jgi:hypothetical protein
MMGGKGAGQVRRCQSKKRKMWMREKSFRWRAKKNTGRKPERSCRPLKNRINPIADKQFEKTLPAIA